MRSAFHVEKKGSQFDITNSHQVIWYHSSYFPYSRSDISLRSIECIPMSRTLFGLALLCLVACTLVAGQCTYDRSPDRDYVTGKVILRDTSDKNPGGAHGPGGSTLKDGFCIDEKDNSLKCQGQAQPIVGLFECSKGQLVSRRRHNTGRTDERRSFCRCQANW